MIRSIVRDAALTLALLLGLAAPAPGQPAGLSELPAAPAAILSSLPAPEGMRIAGDVAVYDAAHLADYIDGAAETYRAHGVVETATVAYRTPGSELPELSIDLHRMGDAKGAQAMHEAERSPSGERLYVGSGGTWQTGMLTFWDGPYYARIVSELSRDRTEAVARDLARLLPVDSILMPIYRLFPEEGRVRKGEQHIVEGVLGIASLNDAWLVEYRDAGGDYSLFLRRNRPPVRSAEIEHLGTMKSVPTKESPIQRIDLKDGRMLLIFYIKNNANLAGYLGAPPDSVRQLRLTRWVDSLPLENFGTH